MLKDEIELPNYKTPKEYRDDGSKNVYYVKNEYVFLHEPNPKNLNNWKLFIESYDFILLKNDIFSDGDNVYKYKDLLIKFIHININTKKYGHWKKERLQNTEVKIKISTKNKNKFNDIDFFIGYYDYDNKNIGFAIFDNNILHQKIEDIDCVFNLFELVDVIRTNKTKQLTTTIDSRNFNKIDFLCCTENSLFSVIEEMYQGKYIDLFYKNDFYVYDNEPIWYLDKSKKIRKRDVNISNKLKEYINKYYEGKCEFCRKNTFKTNKNQFFLEAHHINFLSNGGLDSRKNLIALCPNCHRKAHYSSDNEIQSLQNHFENIVKKRELDNFN